MGRIYYTERITILFRYLKNPENLLSNLKRLFPTFKNLIMLKEREPVLEKLSVVFQVLLTLGCFLSAMQITHTYLKPVSWDSAQYKILLFILVPLWILLLEQANLGRVGRIKMYSITFAEYFTVICYW